MIELNPDICQTCGSVFQPTRRRQKNCSKKDNPDCYRLYMKLLMRKKGNHKPREGDPDAKPKKEFVYASSDIIHPLKLQSITGDKLARTVNKVLAREIELVR